MEKKFTSGLPDVSRWIQEIARTPQPKSFAAEHLTVCETCQRKNAPSRSTCLYCGAQLKTESEDHAFVRPVWRRLELWEKGWNVILLPSEHAADAAQAAKIAEFLRLELTEVNNIFLAKHALPLARVESHAEALTVADFLRQNNCATNLISDVDLALEILPNRVRGIEFKKDCLSLRMFDETKEIVNVATADVALFVHGAIYEQLIETNEQRKNENLIDVKNSRELSSDKAVLDFYVKDEKVGYRVLANSFDFSGLGANKKLLATENFKILLDKLRENVSNAAFDDAYNNLRARLNSIWQLDERKDSIGWQRTGVGKIAVDNRLSVSNAAQFLRYSRVLHRLTESSTI